MHLLAYDGRLLEARHYTRSPDNVSDTCPFVLNTQTFNMEMDDMTELLPPPTQYYAGCLERALGVPSEQ